MAVLIAALIVAGIAVAGVRAGRRDKEPLAQPSESPTAAVTMTFTGAPPYSPTPSESPTPLDTVLPGGTESPSPSDTALPRTGAGATSDSGLALVVLTLMIAVCGGALLARGQ